MKAAGRVAPSGLFVCLVILKLPRSRVIELFVATDTVASWSVGIVTIPSLAVPEVSVKVGVPQV